MKTFEKIVLAVLSILFIGVFILFVMYFRINSDVKNITTTLSDQAPIVIENDNLESNLTETNISQASVSANTTPLDLVMELRVLKETNDDLLKRVEELEGVEPVTKVINTTSQVFQKQIVHVGSASTREREWVSSGAEVTLDSADYPSNVDAVFEVGISVVSGQGWARLVNKSTGAIMTITEVSAGTSNTTWKSSPKFKLHSGSNMYELQIKSSSDELANFSSARIILTQ